MTTPALADLLPPETRLANGCRERAVSLSVDGEALRANLLLPSDDSAATTTAPPCAVLILHGFGGVRSGPHALLTHFARAIGEHGVPSLRFDFRGRGESDRTYDAATLDTMGDDALAAAAYLREQTGARRLVILGICSGGNVGIGVLDRLPDAAGIWALSVYPFGDADSFGRDAARSARYLRDYWRKLFLASTWKRLLRGGIDLRGVAGVILGQFRRRPAQQADATATEPAADGSASDTPKKMPLHNLLQHAARVTITYGEADPDFRASYDYYDAFRREHDRPIDLRTIPDANHNFYSQAWKDQLTRDLLNFLDEVTHE